MKTALLVGVNQYRKLDGNNLHGCLNDVDDLSELLRDTYGFEKVVTLKDSKADREPVLDAIRMLVHDSVEGDELVFLFSGHGTQIPDNNGDESDGYDECLCPADTSMEDDVALIRDDELAAIFAKLPSGVNLTVITDACHSGSNTKDFRRGVENKFLDRGFAPRKGKRTLEYRALPWVHISGCRDNETSADASFDGRSNGALVYALCRAVQADPGASVRDIHADLTAYLEGAGYDQHPVLNGRLDLIKRPIFGGA